MARYSYIILISIFISVSLNAQSPFIGHLIDAIVKCSITKDEIGDEFFNYVKGLIKPRGYDALQKYPALRTDVELLRKLDKYLEGVPEQEALKLKALLDKLPSDNTRRSAIDDIIKAKRILDDKYYIQNAEVKKYSGKIVGTNNQAKGAFGEIASDVTLTEKGMIPLHNRKQSLLDGWGETGIDGVFKRGNEYFIVEAKFGSATLNPADIATGLPKQMTDAWINSNNRLQNAVDASTFNAISASGYRRLLAEVAPDGSTIYKELDGSANVIGIFTP